MNSDQINREKARSRSQITQDRRGLRAFAVLPEFFTKIHYKTGKIHYKTGNCTDFMARFA